MGTITGHEEIAILNDDHMDSSDTGPSNIDQVSPEFPDSRTPDKTIPKKRRRKRSVMKICEESNTDKRLAVGSPHDLTKLPPGPIESVLSRKTACSPATDDTNNDSNCGSKIPPPAHMKASFIKIGTWQWIPKYKGHLVAKILYSSRKLIWEYLENGLKHKIESHWSRIQGLNADIQPGQPGILKIELSLAPSLFDEEPRNQTRGPTGWVPTQVDFTGDQANSCRIHLLKFDPGKLDKPYFDMLKYEPRLQALSRNSFPTLPNPCFPPRFNYNFPDFPCVDLNAGHLSIPRVNYNYPNFPSVVHNASHFSIPRNLEFGSYLPIHYSNDYPQYVQPIQHRAVSSFNNMKGPTMPITGPGDSICNNYAFDSNNFHLGAYGNNQVMKQNREIFRRMPSEATAMQSYQQTQNILTDCGKNDGPLKHNPNLLQTGARSCSIHEQSPLLRASPDSVLGQGAFATNMPQMTDSRQGGLLTDGSPRTFSGLLNGNEEYWQSNFKQHFPGNIPLPPLVLNENLSQMQVPAYNLQRLEGEIEYVGLDDDAIRELMASLV